MLKWKNFRAQTNNPRTIFHNCIHGHKWNGKWEWKETENGKVENCTRIKEHLHTNCISADASVLEFVLFSSIFLRVFFSFLKSHWAIEHGMWCSENKKTQHMMPSRFPLYRERSLHLFITRIDLRTISTLCCWCCCSRFVFLLLSRCFLSIQHECTRTVNYFKKNWSGKYLISFNSCIQYSCNKFMFIFISVLLSGRS